MKKINFIILFLLFFILCGTNILKAATLTVGSNSGAPGDLNISIPVSLTSDPGDDVDAFSLDLNFDALRLMFNGVTPGASTIAASKLIAYSMPSNNKLRLIVYGFNHNIINSGTVLNFSFNIRATAPSGTAAITITNEILVDIDKNTVSSTIVNGNILVQGSIDMDNDGISDVQDNCPEIPNGPDLGTCTAGANISQECTNNSSCGTGGFCSMNQEDTDGNGQGDACQSIPCSISITGLDLPGRRNIPVTCGKTKLLSPCFVDGDCNTPCFEWYIEGGSPIGSTITTNPDGSALFTAGSDCAYQGYPVEEVVKVVDHCNGENTDVVIVTVGRVVVEPIEVRALPDAASVNVQISMDNFVHEVKALQTDIRDAGNHLSCTGCSPDPVRSAGFTCFALEQPDGDCRIVFLDDIVPTSLISDGGGPVFTINYSINESAPSEGCVALTPTDTFAADNFGDELCVCEKPSQLCISDNATVTVGSGSGCPGNENITIPIDFTSAPGVDVHAFSFDLVYDNDRLSFKDVTLGPTAIDADKQLVYSTPSPNIIRVIVYGITPVKYPIEDGTVLNFIFDILSDAPGGNAILNITNENFALVNNNPVAVTIVNGQISVEGDQDSDNDGITDCDDNCPLVPNGPLSGTCSSGNTGSSCASNIECGTGGFCSMNQEDADHDGTGDACEETLCSIAIYEGSMPGRRNIPLTCGDSIQLSFCTNGDCVNSCAEWVIVGGSSIGSVIDPVTGLYTAGTACAYLDYPAIEVIKVVDPCNGNISDIVLVTVGQIILDVSETRAHPGADGVSIKVNLNNLDHAVKAIQTDIQDAGNHLACTECLPDPDRAHEYLCFAGEQPDGDCRVLLASTNPSALISQGTGSVFTVNYDVSGSAPSDACVIIALTDSNVANRFGDPLCICEVPGNVCFILCGDIYPRECLPDQPNCGDGIVDIFDILEEVDSVLGIITPSVCQMTRADVPTGTPPYCSDPDSAIDIFDVLVIIDMALGKANCCDYYYFGEIY